MHYESHRFAPMSDADLEQILVIERRAYAFPWSEGVFKDCLASRYQNWVLHINERLVGYGILSSAVGEAHILNLCIDPERHGQGWGRTLLQWLIEQAQAAQAQRLFLEVRASNRAAMGLYASAGFEQIGLRKGYYPNGRDREDAVVLAKALDGELLGRDV